MDQVLTRGDGMAYHSPQGNLSFYVGPRPVLDDTPENHLDDLEQVIIDFIDGAERELEIAVQEIDSRAIAEAIIRATRRTYQNSSGDTRRLAVRIVMEADYLSLDTPPDDVFDVPDDYDREINRIIHAALLRSKAWVRTDFNPKIFHQKFIIRDNASVLTGSTNFTWTGTHVNLNHVLVIHDEKVAKEYSREFNEIKQGHFGKFNVETNKRPEEIWVDDIRVKVCFAPDHAPEMEVTKQMLKARDRVDFAIFTFSTSSAIDDAMLLLMEAGKTVRGALDRAQGSQQWAASKGLFSAGADLHFVHKTERIGKLHHKLMVIDESVTIAGSFNYTGPANLFNDENIVVLGDDENPSDNQRDLAHTAKQEIDRIISAHARPLT